MQYPYTAVCNWPEPQPQIDWVDMVLCAEHWLTTNVGARGDSWEWVGPDFSPSWLCCVMFKREQDKLLFLLRWAG